MEHTDQSLSVDYCCTLWTRSHCYSVSVLLSHSSASLKTVSDWTRIWLSLLLSLPRHNKPLAPSNGASAIVDAWRTPIDSAHLLQPWRSDFSKGITPLSCHSHNDYTRAVPLFDALAAGCMSVEADIWLPTRKDSDDLLVAHTNKSLSVDRTLGNLYIKPLTTILGNMNAGSSNESEWRGVYQSSTNTTLTFLLDFKSNGTELVSTNS